MAARILVKSALPPAPKPPKAEPKGRDDDWTPRDGADTWRVRNTQPGPFGPEKDHYGTDEFEAWAAYAIAKRAGFEPVLERLIRGAWSPPPGGGRP